MELESLELANKEMEEKLVGLRNRIQRQSTPSLHSIHSEDLICLKKICQLAEEELNLKSCIKELEDKEVLYRRQMKQFLPCEKYQRNNEKVMGCVQSSTGNDKKFCRSPQVHKHNVNAIKKKYTSEGNRQVSNKDVDDVTFIFLLILCALLDLENVLLVSNVGNIKRFRANVDEIVSSMPLAEFV